MRFPRPLGVVMNDLARTLQQENTSGTVALEAITTAAVQAVPGAVDAAIILIEGRSDPQVAQVHTATSPRAQRLDELQAELHDGPCVTAAWEQRTVHTPDMATEQRWPRFAARAVEAGVGSMLCFQLYVHRNKLGALDFYAPAAHAFTDESESTGEVFAAHVAAALAATQREQQLRDALTRRDAIGQAKGIIMERFHLDAARAFDLLTRLSQEENTKLHEIAARLAADVTNAAMP